MRRQSRGNLVIGLILILMGAWFLALQFVPGLENYVNLSWPLIIIGVGVVLLLFAVLGGVPSLAVPACIVGGIGGLLYWQNTTENWESWAYAWTLIPGFVGLGILIASLLGAETREGARGGLGLMLISLVLFLVFGSFFGAFGFIGPYWPVLLILLGALLFIRSLLGYRR
jgi:hypothetical protein